MCTRVVALLLICASLSLAAEPAASSAGSGQVLYNGITLPAVWPPKSTGLSRDPVTPEYLLHPPAVIPIDVGRQLFVDDFLIESTTLVRTHHQPKYHPASPVLKPTEPHELQRAMVFSDGVWWDPADQQFKMWYFAGKNQTCYATSRDGVHWDKPKLDVVPGTNVVQVGQRDSSTVWLDHHEKDPAKRFKMFRSSSGMGPTAKQWGLAMFFSPDGIHWTSEPIKSGSIGDRTTAFFNPFRGVWVYSIRHGWSGARARRYWERANLDDAPMWKELIEAPMWVGADSADWMRDDLKTTPQLYNLDAVAYESVLLGLFTIWRGQAPDRQKPNNICVGFSRDGWSWTRPDRRVFCDVSDKIGDWNATNVQSAGGCCLVVGDELWFYVSGRSGVEGKRDEGVCSTGLAVLRRDGFASLDAPDGKTGTVLTRPVKFTGKRLFVNGDFSRGELRAEVINENGSVIADLSADECLPLRTDSTCTEVRWRHVPDLSSIAGRNVRFRFRVHSGELYAFWVSPDERGTSGGYVAAGGPGFSGAVDK
jgi:hypothetical protein